MKLPENFQFNQKSVAEFIHCKRRFKHVYIDELTWPAVEIDLDHEIEKRAILGARFHKAIQQYFVGIPAEIIKNNLNDSLLETWWDNFKKSLPKLIKSDDNPVPEVTIISNILDQRVVVKLDLMVIRADGRRIIYDWKTSQKRSNRTILRNHIQTRVYPFVLVSAGKFVYPWQEISPEQVEMVYWFSEHTENPERIMYSKNQFEKDSAFITKIIKEIMALPENEFFKTEEKKRCSYCVYRSLCDRGIVAGGFPDEEKLEIEETVDSIHLDFDQISEIEY